jgi:hypothetical protein
MLARQMLALIKADLEAKGFKVEDDHNSSGDPCLRVGEIQLFGAVELYDTRFASHTHTRPEELATELPEWVNGS